MCKLQESSKKRLLRLSHNAKCVFRVPSPSWEIILLFSSQGKVRDFEKKASNWKSQGLLIDLYIICVHGTKQVIRFFFSRLGAIFALTRLGYKKRPEFENKVSNSHNNYGILRLHQGKIREFCFLEMLGTLVLCIGQDTCGPDAIPWSLSRKFVQSKFACFPLGAREATQCT